MKSVVSAFAPVVTVVIALMTIWYMAAVWMNADWAYDRAGRAGVTLSFSELVSDNWAQEKPKLPAPHQVVEDEKQSAAYALCLICYLSKLHDRWTIYPCGDDDV